jgi:hypothetical protein
MGVAVGVKVGAGEGVTVGKSVGPGVVVVAVGDFRTVSPGETSPALLWQDARITISIAAKDNFIKSLIINIQAWVDLSGLYNPLRPGPFSIPLSWSENKNRPAYI